MTVLPVRTVPDPVLRTPAAAVPDGQDVRGLVADMTETMHAVGGVGLAAPQVGVGLRVFVFDVAGAAGHVLNPVLETSGAPLREPGEGCLSVPGLRYHPARASEAVVRGTDVEGRPVEYRGTGLLARCLQHETDHLDGVLYVDRLDGEERREARRRLRAQTPEPEARRIAARRDGLVDSAFTRRRPGASDRPGGPR
ncbi:peptide deformylase [Micrococcus sp.]|uniref:peptide deformylase n=1 Tax=Micrococcus sp. TaxID=1271 RepID=UPI002A90CF24|nr:peptide deformylase [Micrococcus sp.]MDY6054778.1 peptide deformylase [Micrococcus sp.]